MIFRGARIVCRRIAASNNAGTAIEPEPPLNGWRTHCKCGCGGYWLVRLDFSGCVMSFLAHDLEVMNVVDQLAHRTPNPTP